MKQVPECHRQLFVWDKGEKTPKETFSVADLLDYYAISFYPTHFFGNYTTADQLATMRAAAIASAPEWEQEELVELLGLVEKHGLEIILYAIDLLYGDYPNVEQIKNCIPDAEVVLAGLVRNRDYGV